MARTHRVGYLRYAVPGGRRDRGIVMMAALGFIVVLAMVGGITGYIASTNTQMGGHERSSTEAFTTSEAGTEEARARMATGAGANRILDSFPASTTWMAFIGTAADAAARGYDESNAEHVRVDSLQPNLGYTVVIRHAVIGNPAVVEYWGDPNGDGVFSRNTQVHSSNRNIYAITSYTTNGTANRTVAIEAAPLPPPPHAGPLYVEAPTNILGSSTYILGAQQGNSLLEPCGTANPVHGIATPLEEDDEPINENGHPTITGSPAPIQYDAQNINIQHMINVYKAYANFKYTVTSETHTGTETPGPGDDWGTPTTGPILQDPSSCSDNNVVYYNTNNTHIRLSGGVTGCGVLLVEGDLDVHGAFSWYGVILVSGHVIYTGGGNKQVTGTMMSEGSADIDVIGGNANIVYCREAVQNLTGERPLRILSWLEVL